MKHIKLAIVAVLFAMAATAATRVWKTADRENDWDWTDGRNFEGGVAPVAGDIVEVGNTTVKLSDSKTDSFELASSLAQIKPTHKDAKIEFTIDDTSDTVWMFNAMIRNETYPAFGHDQVQACHCRQHAALHR